MISIVALINVNEWLHDESSHIHANIEDSIYSVVKQTYKKWELRLVLYGNNKIDCNVLDNLKLYETKYNAEFDTESGSEKDEYKIRIVYFPDTKYQSAIYISKYARQEHVYKYDQPYFS